MPNINFRIDSGFLDDYYSYGTVSREYRYQSKGFELTIADPVIDPATVAMVKDYYRINHDDDDAQIERNIRTAVTNIEDYTNRLIVERDITFRLKRYPNVVYLPRPVHGAVSTVKTIDDDGTETTLTLNDDYYVYGDKIKWIEVFQGGNKGLEVVYTAGYGKDLDSIPTWAQDAVVYQLGVLYSNFEEGMGTTVYNNGVKLDERAASACQGQIYMGGN